MLRSVQDRQDLLKPLHPSQQAAASNLLHYLSFRSYDVRPLQDQLHISGLSSLASSESHIHSQLQAILQHLGKKYTAENIEHSTYAFSKKALELKCKALFGHKAEAVIPYIMVTFDSSFALDFSLVRNLLLSGMNIARINCAHDDETTWSAMIIQIKRASKEAGIPCKIYMDLAGPKIRTKILGKGKEERKAEIQEGEMIWLSDEQDILETDEVVIGCTLTGIPKYLKKGERIFFDDGIIEAVVDNVTNNRAALRVARVPPKKPFIKTGKGINFPDSTISISSLTEFDKNCLPFICEYADMVGFSFVHHAADIAELQETLQRMNGKPHIILKIETAEAVKNLPALLLQGMRHEIFGVMIARGDLAVEIGFERMSEIQEEILWICEAAHVPVIWATQVLENLNKEGTITRSEVTDAAHAAMAECVLINKGGHTIKVVETLKDILFRSGGHHLKKRYTFRPLNIARRFMEEKNED